MTAPVLNDIIPNWDLTDEAVTGRLDVDLLARAYRFSEKAHSGQTRRNGDPYVTHCVEVAKILAELQLDSVTVASGRWIAAAERARAGGAAGPTSSSARFSMSWSG